MSRRRAKSSLLSFPPSNPDHLLSGNENGSSNFEELNNIITFHLESCKGPCNHDNTTDDNASYDSDDLSMYSSGDSTSSIDLDDEDGRKLSRISASSLSEAPAQRQSL
jgi:hypothetical protein